jgi:hypothetical protein
VAQNKLDSQRAVENTRFDSVGDTTAHLSLAERMRLQEGSGSGVPFRSGGGSGTFSRPGEGITGRQLSRVSYDGALDVRSLGTGFGNFDRRRGGIATPVRPVETRELVSGGPIGRQPFPAPINVPERPISVGKRRGDEIEVERKSEETRMRSVSDVSDVPVRSERLETGPLASSKKLFTEQGKIQALKTAIDRKKHEENALTLAILGLDRERAVYDEVFERSVPIVNEAVNVPIAVPVVERDRGDVVDSSSRMDVVVAEESVVEKDVNIPVISDIAKRKRASRAIISEEKKSQVKIDHRQEQRQYLQKQSQEKRQEILKHHREHETERVLSMTQEQKEQRRSQDSGQKKEKRKNAEKRAARKEQYENFKYTGGIPTDEQLKLFEHNVDSALLRFVHETGAQLSSGSAQLEELKSKI